jgi:hypothetical protein
MCDGEQTPRIVLATARRLQVASIQFSLSSCDSIFSTLHFSVSMELCYTKQSSLKHLSANLALAPTFYRYGAFACTFFTADVYRLWLELWKL